MATRLLEWLGCAVQTCSDGPSGVEAAIQHPADAVLMDLHMPNMDGYTATVVLRERQLGRHLTPVYALTADAIEGVAQRCIAHGMEALLPKPVTRALLFQHLAHLTRA